MDKYESMYADFAQRHNKLSKMLKSLTENDKSKDKRIEDLEAKVIHP